MNEYRALFQPLTIGRVTLKNRIAMAPMGIEYMTAPDGSLNRRVVDYYLERARHGVGMLICSVFKVENEVEHLEESTPMITDASLNYLGELCQAAHSFGCRVFVQLSAGFGRVTFPSVLKGACVSASEDTNFWDPTIPCRALTLAEIHAIENAFGETAERVLLAGADGIELHGHEGYLFDTFTTSLWNRRTDIYGGSLENRLRFPIACLNEIRGKVDHRLAVVYRFGMKHYLKQADRAALPGEPHTEAGRDIPEGIAIAKRLEAAGFDGLHVDAGCYESHYWPHPPMYQKHGCMIDMAAQAKAVVRIPVIGVGRMDKPEVAAKAVNEGQMDIVAIGRGLLADPEWADKLRWYDPADIRPCIGCYDGCFAAYARFRPISCAVNPSCGREADYRLSPALTPLEVMVVGGGIGGMEAARVAALRGHRVTLYEKGDRLGGTVRQAAVPAFKQDLRRLLEWYERRMTHSGISVQLNRAVTERMVAEIMPDAVIVATGARPIIPSIPGVESGHVVTAVDLLAKGGRPGKQAVVIGGGLAGCEVAIWLSQAGSRVSVIEALDDVMAGSAPVPTQVKWMVIDLMRRYDITVCTSSNVLEITDNGVIMSVNGQEKSVIATDMVVLAVGMQPVNGLADALDAKMMRAYRIGDCRSPQNVMNAVWDAYEVARRL